MANASYTDAEIQLRSLCQFLQSEYSLESIIIAKGDEGDVVLSNLVEFSIRYHILEDTKPAILDTMQSVYGTLSSDTIRASANEEHRTKLKSSQRIVNETLRYILGLHRAIKRQNKWMAHEHLYRIRNLFIQLYAVCHNQIRAIHFFDQSEPIELENLLAKLVTGIDFDSMQMAFNNCILLLEDHVSDFSIAQYSLSKEQK